MNRAKLNIGDRIKFSCSQATGEVVTYSAPVCKIENDIVWVDIPERVRKLRFPPANGKRFGAYTMDYCLKNRKES